MAVSRKPKRETPKATNAAKPDQINIEEVIGRGGSVPSEQKNTQYVDEQKSVQLRLYQSTIEEIDRLRDQTRRGKKPSRHAWLVQAIEEKLERESNVN